MTMALGVAIAGSARASDATRVIYDLSALEPLRVATPATRNGIAPALGTGSLPLSTPSVDSDLDRGGADFSGDDLELRRNPSPLHGVGAGSPRGGQDDPSSGNNDPSPTPEPGSMLLLGGALAAGARRWARRR
jgi:hypothetical protein